MTKVITRVYKSPTHGLMICSGLKGALSYALPSDAVLVAEYCNDFEEPPKPPSTEIKQVTTMVLRNKITKKIVVSTVVADVGQGMLCYNSICFECLGRFTNDFEVKK